MRPRRPYLNLAARFAFGLTAVLTFVLGVALATGGVAADARGPRALQSATRHVRLAPARGAPSHGVQLADELADRQGIALLDDFEDPRWPGPDFSLWQVPAISGESPGWWPSTCQAKGGSRSLWAFGGPVGTGGRACDATVPRGTQTSAILKLDLTQAVESMKLDLTFQVWLGMKPTDDTGLFIYLLAPQPNGTLKRVPVFGITGINRRWTYPPRRLDLLSLVDIREPKEVYDLRGGIWRLEWVAIAPEGTDPGGGIFIDDVTLQWEPDYTFPSPTPRPTFVGTPGPSPTLRPTETPLPTLTMAPSPTADLPTVTPGPTEPSPTPEATGTPEPALLFLPILHFGGPEDELPPEQTPTADPNVTPTLDPGSPPVPIPPTPKPIPPTQAPVFMPPGG